MIPYGRQNISKDDINHVIEVLKSDLITQGNKVPEFEDAVANYCNSKFAVAVNSATSALHIACLSLGLSKNDWLWTSPNSFVASANCALYCGAKVKFIDIDPSSYNMSTEALEEQLVIAEKENKLPKIVIPVHFAGQSCDMAKLKRLSIKYSFKLIEDASHAIGGKYKNSMVGSNKYADLTVFSFHPVKIITTGEGGVITTNSRRIYNKLQLLRSHGVTRKKYKSDDWRYDLIDLGFNYRLTEFQAALGLSQLQRLNSFIEKRHLIARKYDRMLQELPLKTPSIEPTVYSSYHLYPITLKLNSINLSREAFFKEMRNRGIGVQVHYIPIYRQPLYRKIIKENIFCRNAESYYQSSVSLPIYYDLKSSEQDFIIENISELLSN